MLALATTATAQDVERAWRGERLSIQVRAGALGNLAWQLDTMSGRTNTRPKDYEALWHKELAWSPADDVQLRRWAAIHQKQRGKAEEHLPARSLYPRNYARFYSAGPSRGYAFRIAALSAPGRAAARANYQRLCGTACAAELIVILDHFWPRFLTWWGREGLPTARLFVPQIVDQATGSGLGALSQSSIRLTAAAVTGPQQVTMDVVIHPKKYLSSYSATVMDDHVLMELVDDPEVGGVRLPLVIHEFTHHFYELAPPEDHTRLVERFLARPEPWSMSAYSVLNEAVAAGIQMLAEKRLRKADDFAKFLADDDNVYFDTFIAKAGRAITPIIEQWLAEGRTIFDPAFVDAYLQATAKELGALSESPRFRISSCALIHSPATESAKKELLNTVRTIASVDSWRDMQQSPHLSAVVFLTGADLNPLRRNRGVLPKQVVREICKAMREHASFAYAWSRSPKAIVYVLYGQDEARLLALTKAFATNDKPFIGLRATVPF